MAYVPTVNIPECYLRFGFDRWRCRSCMVDIPCYIDTPVENKCKDSESDIPYYSTADAGRRLVFSETYPREKIHRILEETYHIKRSSAATYTKFIWKLHRPSTEEAALYLLRYHIIGNSSKVFWLDGLWPYAFEYLKESIATPQYVPTHTRHTTKATQMIIGTDVVSGAHSYFQPSTEFTHEKNIALLAKRWKTIIVLKRPFVSTEKTPTILEFTTDPIVNQHYHATYWRFPRAPLHMAIFRRIRG